jgi:hypothetical protein
VFVCLRERIANVRCFGQDFDNEAKSLVDSNKLSATKVKSLTDLAVKNISVSAQSLERGFIDCLFFFSRE